MVWKTKFPIDEEELEPRDWFFSTLINRVTTEKLDTTLLVSGKKGRRKSWSMGTLMERMDRTFTPSLKNHPAYTHSNLTAKYCHLSKDPIPLIQALDENLLAAGSCWQIDEPSEVENLDWAKDEARALGKVLTESRVAHITVAFITPRKEKVLGLIKDFSDYWVQFKGKGYGIIWSMEERMNRKRGNVRKFEQSVPVGAGPFGNWPAPSLEFQQLYEPIRLYQYKDTTHTALASLEPIMKKKGYIT